MPEWGRFFHPYFYSSKLEGFTRQGEGKAYW
jgi:hypothetical protein